MPPKREPRTTPARRSLEISYRHGTDVAQLTNLLRRSGNFKALEIVLELGDFPCPNNACKKLIRRVGSALLMAVQPIARAREIFIVPLTAASATIGKNVCRHIEGNYHAEEPAELSSRNARHCRPKSPTSPPTDRCRNDSISFGGQRGLRSVGNHNPTGAAGYLCR